VHCDWLAVHIVNITTQNEWMYGQLSEHMTDFCLPTLLANTCWPTFVGHVSAALYNIGDFKEKF